MNPPRTSDLVTLLLASTLVVMAGAVLAPIVEVMRGDLGVTGTAAGLIITAHALALAVASPLVGWMIDRWGVRAPLAGGLVLYGLAGGAGLFITSYPALLADRFVFGVGAAAVFSGTTVALLNLYQGPDRDRVMGWRGTAASLGGVVWPLLGGAVGGISWHFPFAIYLVGIPLGLAAMLSLSSIPSSDPTRSSRVEDGGLFRLMCRRPALLGFYGLQIVGAFMLYALIIFLSQRLAQVGVDAPFVVSLYIMAVSAVMSLVGLVYARLRTRFGYDALLRISVASWIAAFLILATASHPTVLAIAPALFGLGQGIVFTASTVLISEGAPLKLRGQATSLSATATFTGQFVSPLLLGPLVGATSPQAGFLAAAGLAGVILVALMATRVSSPIAACGFAYQHQPVSHAGPRVK
jgi:MFS family permease